MITTLIAVAAAIVGTAAVQHYRYTERRDLLNRIDAAQLLTEQRQTATALVQAEEGRRLAAWGGYYQAWDNDLHHREQVLRHRADEPKDEPAPTEEPVEQEPTARDRFADLPPSSLRILAETAEPQHFEGAITSKIHAILDAAKWHQLSGGELTEALTASRVGAPTRGLPVVSRPELAGTSPVVGNPSTPPGSGDTSKPKGSMPVPGEPKCPCGQPLPCPNHGKPAVAAAIAMRQIALAPKVGV